MGVTVREKVAGSGEYWIFVYQSGQYTSRKIGDKKTAIDIADKLKRQLAESKVGLSPENSKCPTFKNYAEVWIKTHAAMSLKKSTCHGYELIVKRSLIPEFGAKRLIDITPRDVSKFVFGMLGNHRSQTVRNAKNCLSAILQCAAAEDGWIKSNPARGVKVPRPEDEESQRVPDPMTFAERKHFESVVMKTSPRLLYPMVVVGFRSGLRIGELLALQVGDVDFFNGLIRVERNISRGKVTTPKSKASRRLVRMSPDVRAILKTQIVRVKETRLKLMKPDINWLFPNQNGGYYSYSGIVKIWNRANETAKIRHRTMHDMRHTYATLRLSMGHPLPEVSKEMGHSTTRLTYETYFKWLPSEANSDISQIDQKTSSTVPIPSRKDLNEEDSAVSF